MQSQKLRPLSDRVIVQRKKANEMSEGGIVLPAESQGLPDQGKVIAVGPGKYNEAGIIIPVSVKKGDTVLFEKYAGVSKEVEMEGGDFVILKEHEIMAVVESSPDEAKKKA